MILSIGEILFDVFSDYRRIGGAPFNFAYHCRGLGMNSCFISRVGDDENGRKIIDFVREHGFRESDIQIDTLRETGIVDVALDKRGVPEFNIRENAAYDHIEMDRNLDRHLDGPLSLVYFGTVIQRTQKGFTTIQQLLRRRGSETKCLYDVNLRPGCYSAPVLEQSLKQADLVKLNEDEMAETGRLLGLVGDEPDIACKLMGSFGIELLCVTAGVHGSRIYKGDALYTEDAFGGTVIDTVGAGDAFASVLAVGFLKGWKIQEILKHASRFAYAVCGIRGAIPQAKHFYEHQKSAMGL